MTKIREAVGLWLKKKIKFCSDPSMHRLAPSDKALQRALHGFLPAPHKCAVSEMEFCSSQDFPLPILNLQTSVILDSWRVFKRDGLLREKHQFNLLF